MVIKTKSGIENSCLIEQLTERISLPTPITDLVPGIGTTKASWTNIPKSPGIYAICRIPDYDIWYSSTKEARNLKKYNLEWINPLVIYIGQTNNLRRRFRSHFVLNKIGNVTNSIFQKVLVQIIGDWKVVKENILESKFTGATWIVTPDPPIDDNQRKEIERLAILTINPRINTGVIF